MSDYTKMLMLRKTFLNFADKQRRLSYLTDFVQFITGREDSQIL
jgi:hypothetical protein